MWGVERNRAVLVRPRPIIRVLGIIGTVIVTVGFTGVALSDSLTDPLSSYLYWALWAAAATWVFGVFATTNVSVRGPELVIRNVVVDVIVPAGAVRDVRSDVGLVIDTTDGRKIECLGHGRSLIALFRTPRSYVRAQQAITTWVARNAAISTLKTSRLVLAWDRIAALPVTYLVFVLVMLLVRENAALLRSIYQINL